MSEVKKTFYRNYVSPINNQSRRLRYVEKCPYLSEGLFKDVAGIYEITIWEDEAGKILQIPDNTWELFNVKYLDEKEE